MTATTASAADDGTIAITGATGFIGSHLLARLDALGQSNRALIRPKRNRAVSVPNATQVISGSLGDRDAVLALLTGADTCIHLAGATTSVDANGFHAANVIGTYHLAACAAAAGVKHFIYVSSQAARAPYTSNYAASKAIGEIALNGFRADMRITIIRPPAVIGAGDPMLKPMFDLIRLGWLPAPAEPKGGARKFAIISVDDLVSQIMTCLQQAEAAQSPIEPCSLASTNWKDVAAASSEVLDRKVKVFPVWPALLKTVGILADGLTKLTRRPTQLSLGKVRELLAVDWTYDHSLRDAMTLNEVIEACLGESRA